MILKCNIALIRKQKNITQQELSDRTGIVISSISEYENDRTMPNSFSLWKIAIALNCQVDELYAVVENIIP